jgi:hypothetical protein
MSDEDRIFQAETHIKVLERLLLRIAVAVPVLSLGMAAYSSKVMLID